MANNHPGVRGAAGLRADGDCDCVRYRVIGTFMYQHDHSHRRDHPKGTSVVTNSIRRLVRANISLTLDGRYNGPGGSADIGAIVPYMTTDVARGQLTRIYSGATTALLGRGSAEGFLGFWGPMADDENADPRDRDYAAWLVGTDKIVFFYDADGGAVGAHPHGQRPSRRDPRRAHQPW